MLDSLPFVRKPQGYLRSAQYLQVRYAVQKLEFKGFLDVL